MPANVLQVRFLCRVPLVNEKSGKVEQSPVTMTIFATGIGPCGKNVDSLTVSEGVRCLSVIQSCTGGEVKEFLYPWDTIEGRIEVIHKRGR